MKRFRSNSLDSNATVQGFASSGGEELLAIQGAEVLLGLKNASWALDSDHVHFSESSDSDVAGDWKSPSFRYTDAAFCKNARPAFKLPRNAYSGTATRSYVWRGPHRGAIALRKAGADNNRAYASSGQADLPRSDTGSSDDDEVHEQPLGQKQRDKEWAALTTWLRMNLHHPRTLKKLVLFVGHQEPSTGRWHFELNPGLTWDDVSLETKLRLKMLPEETAQAFAHKYPDRPRAEWALKVQKYKAPGSSTTMTVPLSDMVYSLQEIFNQHESSTTTSIGAEQQQPHFSQQQSMSAAAPPGTCSRPLQSSCLYPPTGAEIASASPSVIAVAGMGSRMLGSKGCNSASPDSNGLEAAPSLGTAVAAC